ncbi:MAG: site-specific integrase [Deltaproteobacteria bacterium]
MVGRDSFVGVEDDEVVLSADKAASLAAFGHRLLRREAGRELSLAWSIAWSTGCRPRESLPCREDFVEVAGGYLVHVDRNTGKTGARELYLPRVAAKAFGIDLTAFADRGTRIELPDALLRRHVEQLEAGCRLVRGAWLDRYDETLPGRTSYFIRHAVADMLRERLGERVWLLAEVLGHASIVHDAPTQASRGQSTLICSRRSPMRSEHSGERRQPPGQARLTGDRPDAVARRKAAARRPHTSHASDRQRARGAARGVGLRGAAHRVRRAAPRRARGHRARARWRDVFRKGGLVESESQEGEVAA